MGGAGTVVVFGGVGFGTFATVGSALAILRRRQCQRERALILPETNPSRTFSDMSSKALDDAVFWTICASAVVVYYVKSWWRGHGKTT